MFKSIKKYLAVFAVLGLSSCDDHLNRLNENPNEVTPAVANPNMMLPQIQNELGRHYLSNFGYGRISGVVQHTQEDAWKDGFNDYRWGQEDWGFWYDHLRENNVLLTRSVDMGLKLHEGIGLTIRAICFGMIADVWGDAPYSQALQGASANAIKQPEYDSQEAIYRGVIADLVAARALFDTGDKTGYINGYDIFYNGDPDRWNKFAGTLLLRYAMRVSSKLPDLAKTNAESVYSSGNYIKAPSEDATMSYLGINRDNSFPNAVQWDVEQSNWRRRRPANTLLDKMRSLEDPRIPVWFQPVKVQWIADPSLPYGMDEFIRENGKILDGVKYYREQDFQTKIAAGNVYTRHFNPNLYEPSNPDWFDMPIDTNKYVGVAPGMRDPTYFNENQNTGQVCDNQHASQLSNLYKASTGDLLLARLGSSSETSFLLAEAALNGWSTGSAETHYNDGIRKSLQTWKVEGAYDNYIENEGVAFDGSLEQLITQKWIASWTAAAEAWFDWRRTGFPVLKAGPNAQEQALPVRYPYGEREVNANNAAFQKAVKNLEATPYSSNAALNNSQWAKPWIIQGTGKPW